MRLRQNEEIERKCDNAVITMKTQKELVQILRWPKYDHNCRNCMKIRSFESSSQS